RCPEPIEGTALKADRADRGEMLAVPARRASTDVDRKRCHLPKVEHRAAGGPFLVLGDPDLEAREVELEHASFGKLRARHRVDEIVGCWAAHRRARSMSSRCSFRCSDRSRRRGRLNVWLSSNVV